MTLVEALTALVGEYHIGDFIYHVREHSAVVDDADHEGSSWDHPYVKRLAPCVWAQPSGTIWSTSSSLASRNSSPL